MKCKEYVETARFKRLAKAYNKSDAEYIPFSEEWEKELMKWSKKALIDWISRLLKEREDVKKSGIFPD